MKAILLSAMACIAISGCATNPAPAPQIRAVVVPAECPAPTLPTKPRLPIQDLQPGQPAEAVIRAYAESLRLCAAYSKSLETTLKGYQK